MTLNETHDPNLSSWIASANQSSTEFPIQNLPFGVYRALGSNDEPRACVAIGDQIFDLAGIDAAMGPNLNALAAAGETTWHDIRAKLSAALSDSGRRSTLEKFCLSMQSVEMLLPVQCGDYTDFYTSYHHAYNVGSLFRPDNPVMPNFKWLPVAYHGRASSIVISGTDVRRPNGQRILPGASVPEFGPCQRLDYEVELGLVVGPGNEMGRAIKASEAEQHIFGVVLLNDWSARDIQTFEYQPLGPFLAKNFATTISPWVVTLEALAPYRVPIAERFEGDPPCPPHLDFEGNDVWGQIDINVEAWLGIDGEQERLSTATYASSYWSPAQLIAHHTSGGCPLMPGDILGTGTISGPEPKSAGALLELSKGGQSPVTLKGGEQRTFLQDRDQVILRGYCEKVGSKPIGFGAAAGQVLPSLPFEK